MKEIVPQQNWLKKRMVADKRQNDAKRALISSLVFESRFPVGSSARTMEDEFHEGPGDGYTLALSAREFLEKCVLTSRGPWKTSF